MYESDLRHKSPELEAKLRRLYALNRAREIDLSFRPPYLELLQQFGDPHLHLPPVIHIAGTNGKGSVVAMLRAMLEAGGYSVHSYTSPHLIDFNERIVLAGQKISNEALEKLIDEALDLNKDKDVTFFEITTALAFAAFARHKADILLLETGMGGRLDCTNVVRAPLATIITSLGYDHEEYLGRTLAAIAREKAGIMKPGTPCILAPLSPQAQKEGVAGVFEATAEALGAMLWRGGSDWRAELEENRLVFQFGNDQYLFAPPALRGAHQIQNAGTALAALEVIKDHFPLTAAQKQDGLRLAAWPARLQDLSAFFEIPAGWEIWLDGGHNESAAHILGVQAAEWQRTEAKPLYIIFGMMNHKSPKSFIEALRPHAAVMTACTIPGEPKAFTGQALGNMFGISSHGSPEEAVSAITRQNTGAPGRILITGSLYLAGHVLKTCHNKAHNTPQKFLRRAT